MKVRLLCIGKSQPSELVQLIEEYQKRLPSYIGFERIEIPDLKNAKNLSIVEIQKQEMGLIQKHIDSSDTLILLDENGKEYSSRGFAQVLEKHQNQATQKLSFVVGGAYGFHPDIQHWRPMKMSLSKMTFNHQMVRLFFIEQLYRAFSIMEGKPYHND